MNAKELYIQTLINFQKSEAWAKREAESSKSTGIIEFAESYHQHKLSELTDAWNKYVNYLKEKYPAKDGEQWKFTCEHHQKIDNLLKGER